MTSSSSSQPRPRVAVLLGDDHLRPPGLEPLQDRIDFRFADAAELPRALAGADALFVWDFLSDAVRDAWPAADRLQWVHIAAAGVDPLMFPELTESSVQLTNARGVFDQPIAEYVLAMILAQAKQLYLSRDLQRGRRWEHRETLSIGGQRVLVIGTGGIGRAVARLLAAAGMDVRGAGRRTATDDPDFGVIVDSAELDRHVGDVDHLVMAAPLTPATTKMINATVLAAMKPGAHLINVGRGPSVDEDAVVAAIRSGQLGAASLDVFASEPLPAEHPFWGLDQVVISPHMSGDTQGWHQRLADQFVQNAERWLDGRELINIVDKERGYSASKAQGAS